MKVNIKTVWISILSITLLVILIDSPASTDIKKTITIVKSSNNSYYNLTIDSLIERSPKDISFEVVLADSSHFNNLTLLKTNPVISLGSKATSRVLGKFSDQPVISSYITNNQLQSLSPTATNHFPVLLEQPFERYLAFSQKLLKLNSLGIINRQPQLLTRRQKIILTQLNLNLRQFQTDKPESLLRTIRQLKSQSDALLILPDQNLFNRNTLKGVLLTSYRNRIPVISYSPAHVKSGALASIYSSPEDIGHHLADLLSQYLRNKLKPGQTPQLARYFSISINSRVAYSLGLRLPKESDIRQFIDETLR
ncbi:MAG: hypothetical protein GY763_07335 [Gammaproteobacteria bacterium]|nr:hypothetical protein [Gammaproteobacteria bacterium]